MTAASLASAGEPALPPEATITRDPADGTVIELKGKALSSPLERAVPEFRDQVRHGLWAEASATFLRAYRPLLGLPESADWVVIRIITDDALHSHHVRLQQRLGERPVFGGELIVHWRQDGTIERVAGRYAMPPADLSATPAITARAAETKAAQAVGTTVAPGDAVLGFVGSGTSLRLAYKTWLTKGISEHYEVFVDAQTGELIEQRVVPRSGDLPAPPSALP